jgi:hypothetical protein
MSLAEYENGVKLGKYEQGPLLPNEERWPSRIDYHRGEATDINDFMERMQKDKVLRPGDKITGTKKRGRAELLQFQRPDGSLKMVNMGTGAVFDDEEAVEQRREAEARQEFLNRLESEMGKRFDIKRDGDMVEIMGMKKPIGEALKQ